MSGSYYHWTRRSWLDRAGVDLWIAIMVALLGGVLAGYALALLL
jgi:hypothetical protein